MKRVAILGSTGGLGKQLVGAALEEGLEVVALARDPRKLGRSNEALTIIQGDAETGAGLDALVEGCRYAIWALSSLRPVLSACAAQVVNQLKQVKKFEQLVFVSRVGAGPSYKQGTKVSGPIQPLVPRVLRPQFDDLSKAEGIIRSSGLPYVIVRTTLLTDDPPLGGVVVVEAHEPPPSRVPRADAARFLVELLGKPGWERREVTIGARK